MQPLLPYFCHMKDNGAIKEKICETRRRKGVSQEEMANRMGISLNSYRKLEKGRTLLVSPRIWEIARAMEIKPEELIMDDDTAHGSSLADIERVKYEEDIILLKEENSLLKQFVAILNEKNDLYVKKAR